MTLDKTQDGGLVKVCSCTGPSRGGKEDSFPGPRDVWGAPPSLKNTEKGVPDGFFVTSNMHKSVLIFHNPRIGASIGIKGYSVYSDSDVCRF